MFCSVCRVLQRSLRFKNSLSPMATKHPQEYEIMRKESGACSDLSISSIICHKATPLPDPSTLATLPAYHTETVRSDVTNTEDEDGQDAPRLATSGTETKDAYEQGICRYEYMDIGCSNTAEEDNPEEKTHETRAGETEVTDQSGVALKEEHGEEEEEDKCDSTDIEHPLQRNVSSVLENEPDVLGAGDDKIEEYEEMTIQGVVPVGWEQTDYQNLPLKGRNCPEDAGSSRCRGIGEYIKVCAGMGEPGGNTSFDNPDYWHSRLFLQADAVRT